nr:hypothetical protein GCM10020093_071900 [Planobispora longispora]
MHGYSGDKQAYLTRLRRIEGQIRGLQRMVEEDAYCIDVLTQVSAVTRALQAVALGLLEDHIGHCVADAISTGAGGGGEGQGSVSGYCPACPVVTSHPRVFPATSRTPRKGPGTRRCRWLPQRFSMSPERSIRARCRAPPR